MAKIGFIGAGNMGYPLLCGAVKAFGKEEVVFCCARETHAREIEAETRARTVCNAKEVTAQADCVVLAVKPQFFPEVLGQMKETVKEGQMVISLAPGATIAYLSECLNGKAKVVRTMPNTPAMVGEGMTAVCYGESTLIERQWKEEEKQIVATLFSSVGKMAELPERLMDASIVASGSSPAFVYMFMEALADGAVKYGIPRAQAYEMVAQTVIGAGKMLLNTGEHPGKLKDNVCSPGGTTIAGVAALEEAGFRNAVLKACDACYEKATEMKK